MVKYLKLYRLYINKMAQKSLPTLNKVNTSMIWYSTYYYKYYKWLSSQYIYLLYFLNKLFVFLDFFFLSRLWQNDEAVYLFKSKRVKFQRKHKRMRFYYPVTSYLVQLKHKLIIFNLYYKTTLEKFQDLKNQNLLEKKFNYQNFNVKNVTLVFYKV